ncbi:MULTISPECIES: YlcI/YnfO family protein [unclassified Serratia (in: enterobacteria)]|uniref:YlcI/YnfO family protein n=1 Tax=unclassified Serratia (in: enterobacteria) TaxID=2647522 RepID=UPI003076791E
MANNAINAKSKKVQARTPHDVIDAMEKAKKTGESTGQFIVAALRSEIERRFRKKERQNSID